MKKNLSLLILSSALLFSLGALMAFSISYAPKTINLLDAIKTNTITANITSNGKYSGNSVNIDLVNNTSSSLQVKIPAGTKYHPEDNGEQTLIQMEDVFIALKPRSNYTGKVAAFCTEAHDRCPKESTNMTLTSNTNPKFEKLFTYLRGKTLNKSSYQDAVWAISDNYSVSNIVAEDAAGKAFRKEVAAISGQKDTWFTSPQSVQVDPYGNINMETVNINGRLEFDCTKGVKVRQDIHKANGDVFFASDKGMTPQTNHVTYTFRLSVKGWEKGDYYINIHDGANQLAKYEFSI